MKDLTLTHSITRFVPVYMVVNGGTLTSEDPFNLWQWVEYHLEITGSDYEPADPSVGIMSAGFCSVEAWDADRNTPVYLTEAETERALEALSEALWDQE